MFAVLLNWESRRTAYCTDQKSIVYVYYKYNAVFRVFFVYFIAVNRHFFATHFMQQDSFILTE